jgi:anti-anti-sigma factor
MAPAGKPDLVTRRANLVIRQIMSDDSDVTIAVSGELDMSTIEALAGHVANHLQGAVDGLTLDLHDVAFMDSTGLRLLIELADRARQEQWRLTLIFPRHEAAARVLRVTGADVALPFERGGAALMPVSQSPHDTPALHVVLAAGPHAPAEARAAIAEFSESHGLTSQTLATVMLLVSEVVTNAVVHPEIQSPAEISILACLVDAMLHVEITDQGAGFTPQARDPGRMDGGYGLYLLDKAAARWGIERRAGTTVWFDVPAEVR